MAQAHAEFGLGYSLNAYYGCDAGVPTSGAITLGHLYGKKKMPKYQYYKLFYLNSIYAGSYAPGVAEIELRATPGGPDLITGVVGSSSPSGIPNAYAADNSTSTIWEGDSSSTTSQFISLQLGSQQAIKQIALYIPSYYTSIGGFRLYASNSPGSDIYTAAAIGNGVVLGDYTVSNPVVGWNLINL
ncbi:hypothetical protein [Comamonas sediminis]|uniref:F5/8 type C domain-containing protein n=1 Tax=Comamonas sediminis TaxID=1783360 RepID=A0ABV4AYZ3_9BURK